MFCEQCGTHLPADAKFCNKCGEVMTASVNPSEMHPAVNTAAVKPAAKRMNPLKIILPLVAVAAVAAIVFVVQGVYRRVEPALTVSRAMSSLGEEISQRMETTPLQAFTQLYNTLQRGTVNVNFTFREEWEDWWTGAWHTSTTRADLSVASNVGAGEMAIRGDINVDGTNLDLAAYITRDYIALGSRAVSRDMYGIRFATFREDIREFGRVVGLTNAEMDALADFVEEIERSLNQETTVRETYDDYIQALIDFFLETEQVSERVDVRVGRDTVQARRVQYTITDQSFVRLLNDWLDIFENDETFRAAFDSPLMDGMGNDIYREMMRELRSLLREIERYLRGEITLSFYIGSRDRLLRVELEGEISIEGDRVRFDASLDLGESANDTWTFELRGRNDWGDDILLEGVWEFREVGSRYENTFEWTIEEGRWRDTFTLISDWNPGSGAFTFTIEERGDWGSWSDELLSGNFTTDGETFRLRFEYDDNWRSHLTIEISTERGADIGRVDFINIDRWDQAMLNRIEDALWDVGF